MTVYGKIKGRIAERGLRNEDLCKGLDVSEKTLLKRLRKIKEGNYEDIYQFCVFLDFRIDIFEVEDEAWL